MNSKEDNKDKLSILMEHHRFYSNRTWQYFGAILTINSLIFNSLNGLKQESNLISVISFMSVFIIGIFYHLINWTDMRIENNMKRINELLESPIPEPKTFLENSTNWSKAGILILTLPYSYITYLYYHCIAVLICLIGVFLIIIIISEWTRRNFEERINKHQFNIFN